MKYNIWNKWDPLETIILGNIYTADFFSDLPNDNIRSMLSRICEETLEDLEYFESVLKQAGCTVLRPTMDPSDRLQNYDENYQNSNKFWLGLDYACGITRPPLYPRDAAVIAGNTGMVVHEHKNIHDILYKNFDCINLQEVANEQLAFLDKMRIIDAPSINTLGKHIIIDRHQNYKNIVSNIIKPYTDNFTHCVVENNVIHDGRIAFLAPNVALTAAPANKFSGILDGWDICYVPNSSKRNKVIEAFSALKGQYWWRSQKGYEYFLDAWLSVFQPYTQRPDQFDVNCISLDEKTVLLTQTENPIVKEFLKKHKIESIQVPIRHRYFLDGGLHCYTLDTYRRGEQKDYFPNLIGPIHYL